MVPPATLEDVELRKIGEPKLERSTQADKKSDVDQSTTTNKPKITAIAQKNAHHRVFLTLIKVFLVYQVVEGHNCRYFEFLRNYFKVYVGQWLLQKTLLDKEWAFGLKNELLAKFEKFQPFHMGYKLGTEFAMPGFMFISGYLFFYFMKSRRARSQSFFSPKPFAFWTQGLLSFCWEKFKRLVLVGFIAHILFNCTQGFIEIIPRVLEEGDTYPFLKDKLFAGIELFFVGGYWGRTNHLWFMVALLLFSFLEIPKGVLFSQIFFDKVKRKKEKPNIPLKHSKEHTNLEIISEEPASILMKTEKEIKFASPMVIDGQNEVENLTLRNLREFDNNYQQDANQNLVSTPMTPEKSLTQQEASPLLEQLELTGAEIQNEAADEKKNTDSETSTESTLNLDETLPIQEVNDKKLQKSGPSSPKHPDIQVFAQQSDTKPVRRHKKHTYQYFRKKKDHEDKNTVIKIMEQVLEELFPSILKFFKSWGFGVAAIGFLYIAGSYTILVLFLNVKWYYVSFFYVFPVFQIAIGLVWVYCEFVWKAARKKAAILAIQAEIEEEEHSIEGPDNEEDEDDEENDKELEKLAKEEERAKEKELIGKGDLAFLEMPLPIVLRFMFFAVFGFQKDMWKRTPLHQYYWKFFKTASLVFIILSTILFELFFYLEIWKPDLRCHLADDNCQIADTLTVGIFSHYIYFDTGLFFAMFFHVFIELQESRSLSSTTDESSSESSEKSSENTFCCYKSANFVFKACDSIFWSALELIQNVKSNYFSEFNIYVALICIVVMHFPLVFSLTSPFICPESFYFKNTMESNIIIKDNLKDMCPSPQNILQFPNHIKCATICVLVREMRYDYFNEQFFNFAYNIHTYQDYYMRFLNLSRNWIWIFLFFYFFWFFLDFDIDSKETADEFFFKNYISPFARMRPNRSTKMAADALTFIKWWVWVVPNKVGVILVRVLRDTAFVVYLMHSVVIFSGAMFMRYFLEISTWSSYTAVIMTWLMFNVLELTFLVSFGWLALKIPIVAYLMKGQ